MTFATSPDEVAAWWRGRRAVVTGASGFIGGRLARALVALGAEVHALGRRPLGLGGVRDHAWDLSAEVEPSARLLSAIAPDVVFHCATYRNEGEGGMDPVDGLGDASLHALTGGGGERFVAACAKTRPARLVVLSSSSEYGAYDELCREDMQLRPASVHGQGKARLTAAAVEAAGAGLDAVVLRIFYAYGPQDAPRRFIPVLCDAALNDRGVRLTREAFMRDYVHVDDVVTACLRGGALAIAPGTVINVGTGRGTDNHQLVAMIQALCEGRPRVLSHDFPPRPADTGHWRADTTRMAALLGLTAPRPLEDGLADLLQQMRAGEAAQ